MESDLVLLLLISILMCVVYVLAYEIGKLSAIREIKEETGLLYDIYKKDFVRKNK